MSRQVLEFYYDFASPFSYIADCRIDALLEGLDVELARVPVYLRGFESFRSGMPYSANKLQYMVRDVARTAKYYGIELTGLSRFPVNGLYLVRGAVWMESAPERDAYRRAAFRATWVEQKDVSSPEGAADVAHSLGIDRDAFLAGIAEPRVKDAVRANTERSIAAGAFGVPSFFIGAELYFGQDRLEQVVAALKRS